MISFHVGQKVVCIDAAPYGGSTYTVLPVVGRVYTIRGVAKWAIWVGTRPGLGIWLDEIARPPLLGIEHPWSADRFRPVKTTSIEVFRAMLVTPKQPVNA